MKGLALYNLGGRFNTDMNRVDELRTRVDDMTLPDNERDKAKQELGGLTGTTSGPAVTARTDTLALFKANYHDRSKDDLSSLSRTVRGDGLKKQIQTLWDGRFTGTARNKLDQVFAASEVTQALDVMRKATGDDAAVQTAVGDAITSVLSALHRWRTSIRTEVIKLDVLTKDEHSAVTEVEGRLSKANEQVITNQSTLATARRAADAAAATLAADDLTDDEEAVAKKNVNRTRAAVATQEEAVAAQLKEVAALKADVAIAQTKLQDAKARQQQAASDADTVVLGLINDTIKRRQQLVQETETAVKVVGRSTSAASGAASAPKSPAVAATP